MPKYAAKTVARKPKASGKPNTPAATTGPKQPRRSRKHLNPANELSRQSPKTPPETSPRRGPPRRNPTPR
ncbi:hypothetical protein Trydic_g9503 [Trypoxylus dichotomus]